MKKRKKILLFILLMIFISMFLISGYLLFDYFYDSSKDEAVVDDIKELIVDKDTISIDVNATKDYSALYEANNDFIGWIKIDDTNIDYPVMQTKNDEQYYLRRNFHKQYSFAGTLFCNAAADIEKSMNIIIYGHNMNAGTMFHDLRKYEKQDFYEDHKYIQFDTLYEYGTYEVIAAFRTDVEEGTYKYYNFVDGTKNEFDEYVSNAKRHTPYKIESTAKYGDRLISLSTCAYHKKETGRYVVVAKLIESESVQ